MPRESARDAATSTHCQTCGVLRENAKDYGDAVHRRVYVALCKQDRTEEGDALVHWLNRNGFANLTVCPVCHVDDFVHVEGCRLANKEGF